ncbi:hypothetical protein CMUS01_00234 [Colletotrichum musicola]|uniref:Uncharacterized protein n=1 Tax=Colletotrichum musicola TaxID=2175873 RepID=A0A8H6NZI0_9PEZI|nr:hypothetical protein CMUS01_00234 [Colletotrichum musicola]
MRNISQAGAKSSQTPAAESRDVGQRTGGILEGGVRAGGEKRAVAAVFSECDSCSRDAPRESHRNRVTRRCLFIRTDTAESKQNNKLELPSGEDEKCSRWGAHPGHCVNLPPQTVEAGWDGWDAGMCAASQDLQHHLGGDRCGLRKRGLHH